MSLEHICKTQSHNPDPNPKPYVINTASGSIFCDYSLGRPRIIVPTVFRRAIFDLSSYCKGLAMEEIKSCIALPPDRAYNIAKKRLKERFGFPHIISSNTIDEILRFPKLHINDPTLLSRLAAVMIDSKVILEEMNHSADLIYPGKDCIEATCRAKKKMGCLIRRSIQHRKRTRHR